MKTRFCLIALMILIMTLPLLAEDWLTIYNDDLSLIRSKFTLDLPKGISNYNYDDITSRIDPASVVVTGSGVRVAEQNYEYDLASRDQILIKYLDKEVVAVMKDGSQLTGILKFSDYGNLGIIENSTKRLLIISNSEVQWLQLASLPANFYTKPTLAWSLINSNKGKIPMELSYLSGGFSWDVNYNAVWDGKKLDLNSWVTINNHSGKAFENTTLKLIAGDVNKVRESFYRKNYRYDMMEADMMAGAAAPSFEEREFHDFHIYTLDQKVSFANNQTKQLELYPTQNVVAEGIYEYNTFDSGVKSLIRFMNMQNQGLGKPLPKGKFKIYKADKDKNLEFIGEDSIKHTSVNEEININTGTAFDIVASTQERNRKTISNRASEREIHVLLKNNSKETKRINVVHQLNSNAKIMEGDLRYNYDPNKNTVTYVVELASGAERSFKFKERTDW